MVHFEQRALRDAAAAHTRARARKPAVIFDDGSTDNLKSVLDSLPADWIHYIRVDWKYQKTAAHVQMLLQKECISRCLDMYWNTSQVITFIDVDEFAFPCRDSWGPAMWTKTLEAVANAIQWQDASQCPRVPQRAPPPPPPHRPFAVAVPCMRFGLNGQAAAVPNASVLDTYVRRASYLHLEQFDNSSHGESASEMQIRRWVRKRADPPRSMDELKTDVFGSQAVYDECQEPHSLCARPIGLRKGVYFPNGSLSSDVFPASSSTHPKGNVNYSFASIHGPGPLHSPFATPGQCSNSFTDWSASIDYAMDEYAQFRRSAGMCCNHINFRSLDFLFNKLRKNRNKHLFNIKLLGGKTMDAPLWRFYERVLDTDARDLRDALAAARN